MSEVHPLAIVEEFGERPEMRDLVASLRFVLAGLGGAHDVPERQVTVVLSGNFAASVSSRGVSGFDVARVGGQVRGKTLPIARDYSEVAVVLDTSPDWMGDDDWSAAEFVSLIVHEFGHAVLGRLRHAGGVRPGRPALGPTPAEVGSIAAVRAADEYRCDLVADAVLRACPPVAVEGVGLQPMSFALLRASYLEEFQRAHETLVHPGWSSLVDRARAGSMSHEDMYDRLTVETRSVFDLIGHADAVATAAGLPSVGMIDLPGVRMYLRNAWLPVRAVLDGTGPVPARADFADVDRAIEAAGGAGVAEMFATLGVRGTVVEGSHLRLEVGPPLRYGDRV